MSRLAACEIGQRPATSATSEAQIATLAAATELVLSGDEIARLDATGP